MVAHGRAGPLHPNDPGRAPPGLIAAGVPVAVAATDLPLAEQPAVAHLLAALLPYCTRTTLHRGRRRSALLLGPIGGADVVYAAAAATRAAPAGASRPAAGRRRGRRRRMAICRARPSCPSTSAGRFDGWPGSWRRAASRCEAGAQRRGSCSGRCGTRPGWSRAGRRTSRAGGSAGAAADRDLDAVVDLFDAAARFTDRLPRRVAAGLRRTPGGAADPRRVVQPAVAVAEAVRDTDRARQQGPGVGSGLRRRTCRRAAGRTCAAAARCSVRRCWSTCSPAGTRPACRRSRPQLAEERRLFYVAVTRARRRLVVTAVSGEEEQPSRFLDELDPLDGSVRSRRSGRGMHLPGLVAELRAVVCDPALEAVERADAAAELARLAAAGVSGARPRRLVGAGRRCPTTGRSLTRPPRFRSARHVSSPSCAASCGRCCEQLGARDGDQIRETLGHARPRGLRRPRPRGRPCRARGAARRAAGPGSTSVPVARRESSACGPDRSWRNLSPGCATPERASALVAVEQDFDVVVGDARLRGRVDRLERDRAGRPRRRRPEDRQVQADRRGTRRPSTAWRLPARGFASAASRAWPRRARQAARGSYSSAATARTTRTSSSRRSASRTIRRGSRRQVAYVAGRHARGAVPRDRELLLRQLRREDVLPVDGRRPTGDPMTISARQLAQLLGSPAPTDEQVAVIQAPLAPCVVIAGAGSGKTETMAARVVWLVANRLVAPGPGAGADLHAQGGRRAGRTHPPPARPVARRSSNATAATTTPSIWPSCWPASRPC